MVAHPGGVYPAAVVQTIAVEVHEAGVEAPGLGDLRGGEGAAGAGLGVGGDLGEHGREGLGLYRRVEHPPGRLVVAQTRELPVSQPDHRAQQGPLDLPRRRGAQGGVPLLPQGLGGSEPGQERGTIGGAQGFGREHEARGARMDEGGAHGRPA